MKTAIHHFCHKVVQVTYKHIHLTNFDNILLDTLKLVRHFLHVQIKNGKTIN